MTHSEFLNHCERIEELLKMVGNETPTTDNDFIELNLLSDLVADFEEEHYPIESPTLQEVIELRIFEKI